ncbi:MAG: hypothetical protein QF464_19600, partial [Myxococcota bacterium]|nr:hypothetical protein [Myxococcota bacterium]
VSLVELLSRQAEEVEDDPQAEQVDGSADMDRIVWRRSSQSLVVVTAQTERGVDAPHVAQLSPEGSWEVLDPLYETHPFIEAGTALDGHPRNNCTSPMVRPWQDGWLLACAVLILAQ